MAELCLGNKRKKYIDLKYSWCDTFVLKHCFLITACKLSCREVLFSRASTVYGEGVASNASWERSHGR